MKLYRKNKGFSLVEIIIVVAVIAVLAGVTIGNTADIQQKTQIEQTAGEIRDFFIEVGALASKTQQDIYVNTDFINEKLFAYYYTGAYDNDGGSVYETDWNSEFAVRNFEGGGRKCVDLSKLDWDSNTEWGRTYNRIRYISGNAQLFTSRNADGSLRLNPNHQQDTWTVFSSRRIAYTTSSTNRQFYFIKRGRYCGIIEIAGTGNINMYISKKGSTTDYYPMK